MRKIVTPTVETVKIRMLIPRTINSVFREVGDEFILHQPYAGMLEKQSIVEIVTGKSPPAKAANKKDAK